VTETSEPSQEELERNTHVAFADMDASPTKAWMVLHRNDSQWKWLYDFAFGKRPAEELYDLSKDPDMVINIAKEEGYAKKKAEMEAELMQRLKAAHDPRLSEDVPFEKSPYTDAGEQQGGKKGKGKGKGQAKAGQ
jgi:uncharacterized sulfatase